MVAGLLREDLLSVPGVASAHIDGDAIAPTGVRVQLTPGVDAAVVGVEIQRVLSLHGLRSEVSDGAIDVGPAQPPTVHPRSAQATLSSIRVTEGRDGVIVEALAGDAAVSVRAAGASDPALDQAVVSAVAQLAETSTTPLVRSVDVREIGGIPVATVVVDESGDRLVGSAIVEGGRAYAVGRAVWTALSVR